MHVVHALTDGQRGVVVLHARRRRLARRAQHGRRVRVLRGRAPLRLLLHAPVVRGDGELEVGVEHAVAVTVAAAADDVGGLGVRHAVDAASAAGRCGRARAEQVGRAEAVLRLRLVDRVVVGGGGLLAVAGDVDLVSGVLGPELKIRRIVRIGRC